MKETSDGNRRRREGEPAGRVDRNHCTVCTFAVGPEPSRHQRGNPISVRPSRQGAPPHSFNALRYKREFNQWRNHYERRNGTQKISPDTSRIGVAVETAFFCLPLLLRKNSAGQGQNTLPSFTSKLARSRPSGYKPNDQCGWRMSFRERGRSRENFSVRKLLLEKVPKVRISISPPRSLNRREIESHYCKNR